MSQSVSLRRFAELDGCDESLVRRAVRRGRLTLDQNGGINPELAGTGWRKGNRHVPRCPHCNGVLPNA